MNLQRIRFRHKLPAGRQRIGVPIAHDRQFCAQAANAFLFGRGRNLGNENGRGDSQLVGGVRNGQSMVAARRRDDTHSRRFAEQQVCECTAGFERPRVLQELEFEYQRAAAKIEVGGVNFD